MLALGPLEIVLLLVVLIVFFGWHRSGRLFGKAVRSRDQVRLVRSQLSLAGLKQRLFEWIQNSLFGPK